MVIGLLRLEIRLPLANSLKDKRSVLKRLLNHLRRTYNVSVAELDHQDIWRSAQIGIVSMFNERTPVEQTLNKCARDVVCTDGIEVIDQFVEWV